MRRPLIILLCVLATFAAIPANADDVADLDLPFRGTVTKDYDLIAGQMPYALLTPELWTPTVCAESAYCDVIELRLKDFPQLVPEIWGVRVTVTWSSSRDDNDLWVYDEDEAEVAASYKSGTTFEQIQLLEPDQRFFYLVVLHWGGPSAGYNVTADYVKTELEDPSQYSRPQRGGAAADEADGSAPAFKPGTGPDRPAAGPSEAAPAPVKVPGEDGNPTDYTLPVVQTRGVSQRDDGSPLVTVIVVSILAVIGAGVLTLLIRKRRAEA